MSGVYGGGLVPLTSECGWGGSGGDGCGGDDGQEGGDQSPGSWLGGGRSEYLKEK
jgi:hypothetical protein